MNSRKVLVQTTKSSASAKIPNFQIGGKSPWRAISYVWSKFKCLQLIIVGKEISSGLILF